MEIYAAAQVWLPPIGGIVGRTSRCREFPVDALPQTVYIIGDPAHVGNPDKELTFRPHGKSKRKMLSRWVLISNLCCRQTR